jgi:uncharacterized membrane protein YjgN (DUF898 family)
MAMKTTIRGIFNRCVPGRCYRRVTTALVVVLSIASVLSIATVAQACPACKQALASTEHAGSGDPIQGFMWSILFMMSMPFLLLGGFGTYLWYIVRRARLAAEAEAAAQAAAASQCAEVAAAQSSDFAASQPSEVAATQHEPETVEVG